MIGAGDSIIAQQGTDLFNHLSPEELLKAEATQLQNLKDRQKEIDMHI